MQTAGNLRQRRFRQWAGGGRSALATVRGLHRFLTVYMGCNPCRPQATYVNVDFAVGEISYCRLLLSPLQQSLRDRNCVPARADRVHPDTPDPPQRQHSGERGCRVVPLLGRPRGSIGIGKQSPKCLQGDADEHWSPKNIKLRRRSNSCQLCSPGLANPNLGR